MEVVTLKVTIPGTEWEGKVPKALASQILAKVITWESEFPMTLKESREYLEQVGEIKETN